VYTTKIYLFHDEFYGGIHFFFYHKKFIPWELLLYVGQFRNLIIKLVLRANRFKNLNQTNNRPRGPSRNRNWSFWMNYSTELATLLHVYILYKTAGFCGAAGAGATLLPACWWLGRGMRYESRVVWQVASHWHGRSTSALHLHVTVCNLILWPHALVVQFFCLFVHSGHYGPEKVRDDLYG